MMTGEDLIKFIKAYGLEDCQVEVQYRDDGGCYHGTDPDIIPLIIEAGVNLGYAGCADHKRLVL